MLVHTEDRYGRVVADVWSGGVWMQEMMLREGAAWHYKDFDSDPLLAQVRLGRTCLGLAVPIPRGPPARDFPALAGGGAWTARAGLGDGCETEIPWAPAVGG